MTKINQEVMRGLYYQNGFYLTVPGDIRRSIFRLAAHDLKGGAAPFPYTGDTGSDNYRFTIDFECDTALKYNRVIHDEQGGQHRESRPPNKTAFRGFDRGQVDNCRTPRTRFF